MVMKKIIKCQPFLSIRVALILTCVVSFGGCQSLNSAGTLYNELGGKSGIERIMGEFLTALSRDEVLLKYFNGADVERFHAKFSELLCEVSDGPCEYAGRNMVDIHTGMQISEADFNHTVDLLVLAMNRADISHPVQNKLLARLAPMRADIIKR
ncbi:group 1 truncated hemoglobin [Aurantivibrio plasticivorans]